MALTRSQQAALYFARKRRRLRASEVAMEQEDQGQLDFSETQQSGHIPHTVGG